MPSLKDLKNRIKSVKSTQKITKAMKMVAAAKLRRARDQAEAARPYAEALGHLVESLATSLHESPDAPLLLSGNGKDHVHVILVATSDRGLCGAFNGSIVRGVRRKVRELTAEGKEVKLLFVGRKGYELLHHEFSKKIAANPFELSRKVGYADANQIATALVEQYEAGGFDVAHIVYNKFKSVISQIVTFQQIIPLPFTPHLAEESTVVYEYEPDEKEILAELLPRNLGVQIYHALLENSASFYGAQMTAMDNATRNAGDMIKKLTLQYNRSRQAAITKELIEIISGAEAV